MAVPKKSIQVEATSTRLNSLPPVHRSAKAAIEALRPSIMESLAKGYPLREIRTIIAEELQISEETVRTHLRGITKSHAKQSPTPLHKR
jgi:DNA-binding NarL/FixJ family response regulator